MGNPRIHDIGYDIESFQLPLSRHVDLSHAWEGKRAEIIKAKTGVDKHLSLAEPEKLHVL